MLALPLREVSVKARTGGVVDDEADLAPAVLGRRRAAAAHARPAAARRRRHRAGPRLPAPAALAVADRRADAREPRDAGAARHVPCGRAVRRHRRPARCGGTSARAQPRDRDEMAAIVTDAQRAGHRGERVPWVQRCADTGEVIGTTSYYEVNEETALARDRLHVPRPALVAYRRQHRGEAAAAHPRVRGAGRGAGGVAHRHAQRALAAGDRAARRHAGRACCASTGRGRTAPGATPCSTR